MASDVNASTRAVSVVYWVEKFVTPIGSVQLDASVRTTSGRRNAFQLVTIGRAAIVLTAGRDSGRTTPQEIRSGLAPSRVAASPSARGIDAKKGRRITIDSGNVKAACGSATPSGELSSSSCRITMKSGRIATAIGKSKPRVKSVYTASRPGNEKRAM